MEPFSAAVSESGKKLSALSIPTTLSDPNHDALVRFRYRDVERISYRLYLNNCAFFAFSLERIDKRSGVCDVCRATLIDSTIIVKKFPERAFAVAGIDIVALVSIFLS